MGATGNITPSSQPQQEERRLATIMFTDIVGYTAITQKNESLAMKLLEQHREILRAAFQKFGGKEIKTVGDAFVVEFNNTLDAVNCAFEIQRELHVRNGQVPMEDRIFVRLGVHLGDVIHSSGDIYGDAVNIASRIEPFAEPGGICVSQQVYDQVWNKTEFTFKPIDKMRLKNVQLPIELYKVVMPWETPKIVETETLSRGRIAILPFRNITPDGKDEYFADGLTEELIASISKIAGLRVIARTSVMKFKGSEKSIGEIARELQAGTVLGGTVRKVNDRVRVTVELIDGSTEEYIWTETYDRPFKDIFAIQTDIAERVSKALRVQLLSGERRRIRSRAPQSAEAYNVYMKGRFHFFRGSTDGFLSAIQYFEEAIELDPNFALAYAGLSNAYMFLVINGHLPTRQGGGKAKAYAAKALELDPMLAEAHLSMAMVQASYEWNFEAAEKEFKRALELNTSYAFAHARYGLMLLIEGRVDEALSEVLLAEELDPLSSTIRTIAGTVFYYLGRCDEAMLRYKRSLELDPQQQSALDNLGMCHVMKGELDLGVEELKKAVEMDQQNPFCKADLAYAYVKCGKREEAEAILEALKKLASETEAAMVALAGVYAILGDKESALDWLENAYGEHSHYLRNIGLEYWFENIRGEERFRDLMRRMGLPPTQNKSLP
ncbi:MAG: tetratricopeptide repeat protein [Nitrososphaerota archaeon]|nr:tetratricopeptide repeat protein [Nitrososphaerota archaeon]